MEKSQSQCTIKMQITIFSHKPETLFSRQSCACFAYFSVTIFSDLDAFYSYYRRTLMTENLIKIASNISKKF